MCGIAGIWNGPSDSAILDDILRKLAHRGPDATGLHRSESGALGHRRLSIMDPEGGDQPIYSEDRSHAIVANGEIYNFNTFRKHLNQPHIFRTGSDSEAVLHLYEETGRDVVKTLDGMYAFAVTDGSNLFAARDPLGIKPLYYAESGGRFWFSSEIEPLASHVEHVTEFPPGTYYDSRSGFHPFYSVPDVAPRKMPAAYFIPRLRRTLEKSVIKRLMSDVPLGAFLSGGLDSSIIAAVASRNLGYPLHTFSVGTAHSPDLEAARFAAKHLGTIHHEYVLTTAEIMETLPEIIKSLESYDMDLVRSAIPCYFTARLAAKYVKVILTGEGADELFAGYTYYRDMAEADESLRIELRRSVSSLHNINLQRVDRLTMRHSVEGRVPFLDLEMVNLAQEIPVSLKLRGRKPVEKWILRKAFEHLLPHEIVWRKKSQFDEGSGTMDLMQAAAGAAMSGAEAESYMRANAEAELRCPEECYYHRIFMNVLEQPERTFETVARWARRTSGGRWQPKHTEGG